MKTENRTEQIGLKITPTQREKFDNLVREGSSNMSTIAYDLVSIWIDACEKAGRFIAPHHLITNTIYPGLTQAESIAIRQVTETWLANNKNDPLILSTTKNGSFEVKIGKTKN